MLPSQHLKVLEIYEHIRGIGDVYELIDYSAHLPSILESLEITDPPTFMQLSLALESQSLILSMTHLAMQVQPILSIFRAECELTAKKEEVLAPQEGTETDTVLDFKKLRKK